MVNANTKILNVGFPYCVYCTEVQIVLSLIAGSPPLDLYTKLRIIAAHKRYPK